ncbi:MAG TPA: hypothetical protein ENN87_09625 [Phycisphaerales bacterium]|nr:hypothetical protein [Phycisphaerales bacterium]
MLAHPVKLICVSSTVTRTSQSRVISPAFINRFALKIGKPSLDVPCRHKNSNTLPGLRHLQRPGFACPLQLDQPAVNALAIAVDNDYEALCNSMAPGPVRSKFLRKSVAHKRFGRTLARWCILHPQTPRRPTSFFQEAPGENLVLSILT